MTLKATILNVIETTIQNGSFYGLNVQDDIAFKAYYNIDNNHGEDSINLELCFYNKTIIIDNLYSKDGEFNKLDIDDITKTAVDIYKETLESHLNDIKTALETATFNEKYYHQL